MSKKIPEGALKTTADIEALIAQNKVGDPKPLYQVRSQDDTWDSNIENMIPFYPEGLTDGGGVLTIDVPNQKIRLTSITLKFRHIKGAYSNIETPGVETTGFLFANYFHALAYDLQMKKKHAKKP